MIILNSHKAKGVITMKSKFFNNPLCPLSVKTSGNSESEKKAENILNSEITEKKIKSGIDVVFRTENFESNDYFEIEKSGDSRIIKAKTVRGFIYGIGLLLRKTRVTSGKVCLVREISGKYRPYKKVRGHQCGYRPLPNTYDAWSYSDYERYLLEMMYFGANTFEDSLRDGKSNELMKYDEDDFLVKISEICDGLDMNVSIWYPNDEKETLEDGIKDREKVFSEMKRIDFYFPPGGDPGKLDAVEFIRRTEIYGKILKKYHPGAKVYPSAQSPDGPGGKWAIDFIDGINSSKVIDGYVYGPNWALPCHELRERIDKKYPMRFYPDITHSLRCEYPVHFTDPDRDYSFDACLSREASDPRPQEYRELFDMVQNYSEGSVSYSEGVHDDVNKFVYSDMDFYGKIRLRDTLSDYSRLFFPGADEERLSEDIEGQELSWVGDPEINPVINAVYNDLRRELENHPELNSNWRYMMLLFRSACDKYIKLRKTDENDIITDAVKNFELGGEIGFGEKEDFSFLRNEIFEIGDKLNKLIGIQLDVENQKGAGWERGCVLDTVDSPVSNLDYYKSKISEYPSDREKTERLFNIRKRGGDEFYFSFALQNLDELNVKQSPYYYIEPLSDMPEYRGKLPVEMSKIYDHYSLKFKTGGLTEETGYKLCLNIKPRYRQAVKDFTVKVNGAVIYSGKQYGGTINKDFNRYYGNENFEMHEYNIPSDLIKNGCVEIEIGEPLVGIQVSEIFILKME